MPALRQVPPCAAFTDSLSPCSSLALFLYSQTKLKSREVREICRLLKVSKRERGVPAALGLSPWLLQSGAEVGGLIGKGLGCLVKETGSLNSASAS